MKAKPHRTILRLTVMTPIQASVLQLRKFRPMVRMKTAMVVNFATSIQMMMATGKPRV